MPRPVDPDSLDAVHVVEVEQCVAGQLIDLGPGDRGRTVCGFEIEKQTVDEKVGIGAADESGPGEAHPGGCPHGTCSQRAQADVRQAHLIVDLVDDEPRHVVASRIELDDLPSVDQLVLERCGQLDPVGGEGLGLGEDRGGRGRQLGKESCGVVMTTGQGEVTLLCGGRDEVGAGECEPQTEVDGSPDQTPSRAVCRYDSISSSRPAGVHRPGRR